MEHLFWLIHCMGGFRTFCTSNTLYTNTRCTVSHKSLMKTIMYSNLLNPFSLKQKKILFFCCLFSSMYFSKENLTWQKFTYIKHKVNFSIINVYNCANMQKHLRGCLAFTSKEGQTHSHNQVRRSDLHQFVANNNYNIPVYKSIKCIHKSGCEKFICVRNIYIKIFIDIMRWLQI